MRSLKVMRAGTGNKKFLLYGLNLISISQILAILQNSLWNAEKLTCKIESRPKMRTTSCDFTEVTSDVMSPISKLWPNSKSFW